jgi:GrpB-like predicted nucleotidyltransferase (UPF0157 family)
VTHHNSDKRVSTGPPGFTAAASEYRSLRRYRPVGPPSTAGQPPSPRSAGDLHGYDPRWPRIFVAEQRRIRTALGALAIAVEHIGSSSVPGLSGRAEIDVLVGVADGPDVDASTHLLTGIGYRVHDRAPPESDPWSLLLRAAPIPFELLVVEHRSPLWNRTVRSRDYLRQDPARALAYGRLKSRWAARHEAGTAGYQEAKRRFWDAVNDPAAGR